LVVIPAKAGTQVGNVWALTSRRTTSPSSPRRRGSVTIRSRHASALH